MNVFYVFNKSEQTRGEDERFLMSIERETCQGMHKNPMERWDRASPLLFSNAYSRRRITALLRINTLLEAQSGFN